MTNKRKEAASKRLEEASTPAYMTEPALLRQCLNAKEVVPPVYVEVNPHTDMSSLVSMEEAQQFKNVQIFQEWRAGNTHRWTEILVAEGLIR
jgi:hypothetical protein